MVVDVLKNVSGPEIEDLKLRIQRGETDLTDREIQIWREYLKGKY